VCPAPRPPATPPWRGITRHWLTILETCYRVRYLRPHSRNFGTEVDLVLERGAEPAGVEVKSVPTVAEAALASLRPWQRAADAPGPGLRRRRVVSALGRVGAVVAGAVGAAALIRRIGAARPPHS
jgi:hypothetical protein